MESAPRTPRAMRFGVFEVDLRAGELRKQGIRIKVQEKPFQVLATLLARPDDLVTREELREKLWPGDTFVDFDHGINIAINKLREALGDSAESPRFIETLARRGYRFIAPVEPVQAESKPSPSPVQASPPVSEDPLVGKTISHYRILEKLGGGGMGVVYKAEDTKLGRNVALKFLPEKLAKDRQALERFLREARAASALNHPNICTIHGVEEYEGQPFIVMEFLQGQTLKDLIAGKPLETGKLLDLAVQIAEGLNAAHSKGIIHRDIKPANIMVIGGEQVKLLDFGLAKLLPARQLTREAAGASAPTPSETTEDFSTGLGGLRGTAAYMSPEQARGEELDARTDLFSFGAVLYEMATGQQAFSGSTMAVVHDAILSREPVPALRLNPHLPEQVDAVIDKALKKDRESRYQAAADLRADLERLNLEFHAEKARTRKGPARRFWMWRGVTVVALLAGVLVAAYFLRRPPPLHRKVMLAVLPFDDLSGDAAQDYFSDGLTDEMITQLGRMHPERLGVIARTSAMLYKHTTKRADQIGRELRVDYILEGSVSRADQRVRINAQLIQTSDQTHVWADSYERDLRDVLALQSDVARAIAEVIQLKLTPQQQARLASARPVNPGAYEDNLKGRYYWNKRTEEGFKRAVDYFHRAIAEDPNYAPPYAGLADTYSLLGSVPANVLPPQVAMPKAKEAATKALEMDDSLADAHVSLGYVKLAFDWDFQGAEREFKRAIELNPGYPIAHQWYAFYLTAMGRLNEAREENELARKLDPLSLVVNSQIAWSLYIARRYDEAIEQCRKTLEMEPNLFPSHLYLGLAYEQKKMYPEAIAEFQKGKILSGRNPIILGALGHTYAVSGNRAEARKTLAELDKLSKQRYVPALYFAAIYAGLGEKDRALDWLNRAVRDRSDYCILLKMEPEADSLRSDPRFQDLLRQIGLPP